MQDKCKDIIVLTKSKKWQNYCVAAIDMESNSLVRLISDDEEIQFAIKARNFKDNRGKEVGVFDRIIIDANKNNKIKCQPENYTLNTSKNILNKGKVSSNYLKAAIIFLSNRYENIFYNNLPFVRAEDILHLPINKIHSIELIKAEVMILKIKNFVSKRLKANILYNNKWYDGLSITDMEFNDKYYLEVENSSKKKIVVHNVYMLISLTDIHEGKYFKVIAGVYEFNTI